jgi:glc operon protein GlcG
MNNPARILLACISLVAAAVTLTAQTATKPVLTLELAKRVAAAANAEAARNNWTVVIAIVDDGGRLVYLERMDGTQIGSIDVARLKAETAINFRRPTKAFQDGIAGGQNQLLALAGALPLEGGVPLQVDGQFVGAIGISGMTSAQDGQIAAAGITVLTGR